MKKFIFLLFFWRSIGAVSAQETDKKLSLQDVLYQVRHYHPVAMQAGLIADQGTAGLLKTRGEFDPKIGYENTNKFFQGKNYYDIGSWGLTIPTWPGADIQIGTNTANGVYLNPDETTPAGGLSGIGISMPVLRNLITDQRRTLLNQAKLVKSQNQAVRTLYLNQLCADVLHSYTDWYLAWKELEMYRNAHNAAELRLQATRQEVIAGSKAAVDTLESYVQKLNFATSLQEAEFKVLKYRLGLSVHLWNQDGKPLEPDESVVPEEMGLQLIDSFAMQHPDSVVRGSLQENHPILIAGDLDIQFAALDMKYKKQNLLPELNIKYRFLAPGSVISNPNFNSDNYQFGLKFGTSLFLRKERGEYQIAKLKTEACELKLMQKNREIGNKSQTYWQQRITYKTVVSNFDKVVDGYELLYQTEITRMEAGESNMFLVNTRELRLIENKLKLIQYNRKYLESNIDYLENAGVLWYLIQ